MNWNSQPRDCFASLTFIMDHLLIQPLSAETEGQRETYNLHLYSGLLSILSSYIEWNVHITQYIITKLMVCDSLGPRPYV